MTAQGRAPRLLRRPEVEARVGLKRSMIYLLMSENRFPKPVRISDKAVGWIESEIDEWIVDRIAASRAAD